MRTKTLNGSIKSIALALLLGGALTASSPSAFAGAAELKALQAALPAGVTIEQATSQQLFNAFMQVVFAVDSKFNNTKKQGVVAGEALKAAGPNALDAGEFFGTKITESAPPNPASVLTPIYADRRNFVSLAASTAGTGKGLNVAQIPGLSAEVFVNELGTTFTTAAQATKSKPGQGAIFGGRARQIFATSGTPVVDSTVLANSAIFDKKLSAATQDITQWIAAEFAANGADSAAFAVGVADGNGPDNKGGRINNKYALKIATGAAAGDPTNAGNIVHNLLNQQLLQSNGTTAPGSIVATDALVNTMVKGVTSLAKTVSAVADIEEIQKVGNAFGQLMSLPGAKAGTAVLSVTKAASLVKTLATAVMAKPRGSNTITDRNSDANKQDEIAEVAAYMVGGLVGSPELIAQAADAKKVGKAASTLLGIITSATSVKPKVIAKNPQGPIPDTFAADVTASVALSVLNSTLPQTLKDAFMTLLLKQDAKGNYTTLLKINKATGTPTGAIITALNNVYDGNAANNGIFEDGNVTAGAVSDPETDTHPFSGVAGAQS
jgi:hypothetical protein